MAGTVNLASLRDSIIALLKAVDAKASNSNAATLEGQTLAQITASLKTLFQGTTSLTTTEVDAKVEQVIADLQGLTKADVGLGLVENFGIATQAEAENLDIATATADKYMTHQRALQLVKSWWADQTSTTSATLDTINEIAAAIESNQNVIQTLNDTAASKVSQTAFDDAINSLTTSVNTLVADDATFAAGTSTTNAASVKQVRDHVAAAVLAESNDTVDTLAAYFAEVKGMVEGTTSWPA